MPYVNKTSLYIYSVSNFQKITLHYNRLTFKSREFYMFYLAKLHLAWFGCGLDAPIIFFGKTFFLGEISVVETSFGKLQLAKLYLANLICVDWLCQSFPCQ